MREYYCFSKSPNRWKNHLSLPLSILPTLKATFQEWFLMTVTFCVKDMFFHCSMFIFALELRYPKIFERLINEQ